MTNVLYLMEEHLFFLFLRILKNRGKLHADSTNIMGQEGFFPNLPVRTYPPAKEPYQKAHLFLHNHKNSSLELLSILLPLPTKKQSYSLHPLSRTPFAALPAIPRWLRSPDRKRMWTKQPASYFSNPTVKYPRRILQILQNNTLPPPDNHSL